MQHAYKRHIVAGFITLTLSSTQCALSKHNSPPTQITNNNTARAVNVTGKLDDQKLMDEAVADNNLIRAKGGNNIGQEFGSYNLLGSSKKYYWLSLKAYMDSSQSQVNDKIVSHVQSIIGGGREPTARSFISGWADGTIAWGLTLNKKTPAVWNQLSAGEKEKVDWLMKALTVAGNWHQNFDNNIGVGLCNSNRGYKQWNPNIQEGYVAVMMAAYYYFGGADKVNNNLQNFNYDTYMNKFQSLGFTNITNCWQQIGKTLMEKGGKTKYDGTSVGVRKPFTYELQAALNFESWPADLKEAALKTVNSKKVNGKTQIPYEPYALYDALALRFYGRKIGSNIDCYPLKLSSYAKSLNGKIGMPYEFASGDAQGVRCSPRYVWDGWMNNIPSIASLLVLGDVDRNSSQVKATMTRLVNGSDYFISAYEGGYKGREKGSTKTYYAPSVEKYGWKYIKNIYDDIVRPEAMKIKK